MENIKQNRTAVYFNVVPSVSKKNDDGLSNQTEREMLSFCEKNNMRVDSEHIYRDMRFRFGGLDGFPGLCLLLEAAKRHDFDSVVFFTTSHLPDGEALWEAYRILKTSGTKVIFTNISGELARQCKDILGQMLFVIDELERRLQEARNQQMRR